MWRSDPALFQALTASGNLGLLILDAELHVVEVNPWLADRVRARAPINKPAVGAAPHAANTPLTTLFPDLPPPTWQHLQSCLQTRQSRLLSPLAHHPIFPLPSGGVGGLMRQIVRLIPLADSPGLAVLIEDVSEQMAFDERLEERIVMRTRGLMEAEARQRALLAAIGEAVIVTDLTGRVTEWAAASPDIYGWRADEVLGRPLSDFMPTRYEDPAETHQSSYAALLEAGVWRGSVIQSRKDGSPVNIASTVTLLCDAEGQPTGMVAVNRNITKSKELGATLSRLEQINRAISSRLSLDDIFNTLAAQLQGMFPFDHVSLSLFEPDMRSFVIPYVVSRTQTYIPLGQPRPLDGSLLAIVARTRQALIVPDIETRTFPFKAQAQMEGVRSIMLLPLISVDDVLGAINFGSCQLNAFTPHHADLLANTADQIAIAIITARLFEDAERMQASLEGLSQRLLRAQEDERARLARELHDHVGQQLTALKLNLQQAAADLRGAPAGNTTESVARLIDESRHISDRLLPQVRDMALSLRPALLDDLGLVPALRWHLERAARPGQGLASAPGRGAANLAIHFSAPDDIGRFSEEIETVFFRVAQEACANAQRHAHAKNLWVQLARRADRLELHITDDGAGFEMQMVQPLTGGGLGLKSMAERAELIGAQLEIDSAPGQGARISLVCACEPLGG